MCIRGRALAVAVMFALEKSGLSKNATATPMRYALRPPSLVGGQILMISGAL
jgi:hypothetical protein